MWLAFLTCGLHFPDVVITWCTSGHHDWPYPEHLTAGSHQQRCMLDHVEINPLYLCFILFMTPCKLDQNNKVCRYKQPNMDPPQVVGLATRRSEKFQQPQVILRLQIAFPHQPELHDVVQVPGEKVALSKVLIKHRNSGGVRTDSGARSNVPAGRSQAKTKAV